jgi:hypothetical protein
MYVAIGVTAILSYLQIREGGADESSLLAFLNDHLAGKVVFWLILLGTISYIIWRMFESIRDPYNYGKSSKGLAIRFGVALSTIPDLLICLTAVQILSGASRVRIDAQPVELRQIVGSLLEHSSGELATIAVGVVVCTTAFVQFFYGITKGYNERMNISRFNSEVRWLTHFFAWVGYFARGIILGIIGYFFLKAGVEESAKYVVNTDKAFDFIGDNVGHLYFVLVAIGTICYGIFMFIQGLAYDADKD